jgi:hypothetical protein
MTTDNFCLYSQNRLIQTGQTGGEWYSDASPFSFPWIQGRTQPSFVHRWRRRKKFYGVDVRPVRLLRDRRPLHVPQDQEDSRSSGKYNQSVSLLA